MDINKFPRQKILIVDDNPINLDFLKGILQSDYTVLATVQSALAVEIAKTKSPDLILLDIIMPEMDGYEVCKALKANEKTAGIPVIFVTSKENPEDETKGFEMGCVDYIKKPFNPIVVSARVKTHLTLSYALHTLEGQNEELKKAVQLREEVERITRHDLKNPMSAIFSGLYFLGVDPGLGTEAKEHVQAINEAAQDMLSMINFSLCMFKMEQGLYIPELSDVNIMESIYRIQKDLRALARVKNSCILIRNTAGKTNDQMDGFTVRGEPLLVYSLLVNLLKNALEATPEGEPVTVTLTDGPQDQALIRIHNMGAVPESIRKTVFEKFVTSGKKKGTGLGTYSAMLITRLLGGDIFMETSEQKGTVFFVSLVKGNDFQLT